MGGVDLMDQQIEQLHVLRKSYKWYRKLFLKHVLQCTLSSHKLYKSNGGVKDYLGFLHDLVTQLLSFTPRLNATIRDAPDNIACLTGRNHFPGKHEYLGTGAKKKS